MDLNQLANQLASGLGRGDLATDRPATPTSAPRVVSAEPRGVRFAEGDVRLGDVVDHTLLEPGATAADIDRLCDEALHHRFAAACVNSMWVARCAARLGGSGVALASVIGFPLGAASPAAKAAEAARAVRDGATELDTVVPLGALLGGDWQAVHDDVGAVVQAADGALVKVILETARLTPMQILRACAVAGDAGAHYVKTSTGFSSAGGASAEAVALMRLAVGDDLGVKASGGVRDAATALRMLANGATRIGTSSGTDFADVRGPGPRRLRDLLAAGRAAVDAGGPAPSAPPAAGGAASGAPAGAPAGSAPSPASSGGYDAAPAAPAPRPAPPPSAAPAAPAEWLTPGWGTPPVA